MGTIPFRMTGQFTGPLTKMWTNRVLPLFKMEKIYRKTDSRFPHVEQWYRNKFTLPKDSKEKKIILFLKSK
jgi:hypothetical protein